MRFGLSGILYVVVLLIAAGAGPMAFFAWRRIAGASAADCRLMGFARTGGRIIAFYGTGEKAKGETQHAVSQGPARETAK
jgi:hypothetical protein